MRCRVEDCGVGGRGHKKTEVSPQVVETGALSREPDHRRDYRNQLGNLQPDDYA